MRLWHEKMLPFLSKQHLQGLHRECCAMRGLGWERKHATVDYVFTHSPMWLADYHGVVMTLLVPKGVRLAPPWWNPCYRGLRCEPWPEATILDELPDRDGDDVIYPEHNAAYWRECRENLKNKGFDVSHIPEEEPK